MTCLWKSANNADSHKPLGFAAFPTGPTAGMHHNQPISGQQRSTLRPGIFCLKNGETLRYPRWLTDSRVLVYADRGTIYVVDRVSKEIQEVLSSGPDSMSFLPAPSPDDRTLYYVSRPPPEADVWLISLPDESQ